MLPKKFRHQESSNVSCVSYQPRTCTMGRCHQTHTRLCKCPLRSQTSFLLWASESLYCALHEPNNVLYWPWTRGLVLKVIFFPREGMLKIVSVGRKDNNQFLCPASIPCENLYLTYFLAPRTTLLYQYFLARILLTAGLVFLGIALPSL